MRLLYWAVALFVCVVTHTPVLAEEKSASSSADTTASASINSDRLNLALKMMEVAEVTSAMTNTLDALMPSFAETIRQAQPDWSDTEVNQYVGYFSEEARAILPQLKREVAEEYARRFSEKELRYYIAFYETPEGKHLSKEQPAMMSVVNGVGRKLGMQASIKALMRMAQKPPGNFESQNP